ncbi:MAG: permease prefix domain 1-containing protein [Anaerolineae bacterium]
MIETPLTIDQIVEAVRRRLDLSSEAEWEILTEVRTHLEDAVAAARASGLDEQAALRAVVNSFGADETGRQLQQVHAGQESADAVIACALPVLCALILRWVVFSPDGSALGWPQLLIRPAFWIVAVVALLVPLLQFRRWRYALIGWGFFWTISILFVVFPAIRNW